jgi:hypothetical protein
MVKMENVNVQENLNKVPLETLFIFAKLLIFFLPDDKKTIQSIINELGSFRANRKLDFFFRFVGLMVNLLERSEPL